MIGMVYTFGKYKWGTFFGMFGGTSHDIMRCGVPRGQIVDGSFFIFIKKIINNLKNFF